MRILIIFLVLAALVLTSFFIWEDDMMTIFTQEGSVTWLRQYGGWAWAIGVMLLISDLFLPLPATLIMSALGYIYGPWTGGLISTAGSFAAGSLGYWLCRLIGDRAARCLLGEKDYVHGKKLSGSIGGWIVVLSRWLPVFPEVISCMAGLIRMPPGYFHAALACGSLPLGFIYAYIGNAGITYPWVAIVFSVLLPPIIWLVVRKVLHKKFINEELTN